MTAAARIFALLVIAVAVAAIANCSHLLSFALNTRSYVGAFARHADLAYGPNERHRLDVYAPDTGCNQPVVLFWYGGLWIQGSKADYRFVGAELARAGYVAVLPDYRLFPQVRFPEFIEDGARALRWAQEHAGEYGGNPAAIFLMGHSAGAFIAASLALNDRYARDAGVRPDGIRGFIGLSGPYMLDAGEPTTSLGLCAMNMHCEKLLARIFAEPYSPPDWRLLPAASTLHPAVLLLHGTRDVFVPYQQAELLRDRLQAAGFDTQARFYEDVEHDDTVLAFALPLSTSPPIVRDVRRFIDHNARMATTRCPARPLAHQPDAHRQGGRSPAAAR